METTFFLNQHNFEDIYVMTLYFIYLRTELNYLSNDIILCGFVVVVYTLYRWTSHSCDAQLQIKVDIPSKKTKK